MTTMPVAVPVTLITPPPPTLLAASSPSDTDRSWMSRAENTPLAYSMTSGVISSLSAARSFKIASAVWQALNTAVPVT